MKACISLNNLCILTARSLVLELPDGDINGEAKWPIVILEALGCDLGE